MTEPGATGTALTPEPRRWARLAVGGYGLFGVVIDADLAMVENSLLTPGSELTRADAFAQRFVARVNDPSVHMSYGRLSVAREGFLREALLVGYTPAPQQHDRLPSPKNSAAYAFVSRGVFRAQTGSERGKQARWIAETRLMPQLGQLAVTRNTLLDTPVRGAREPRFHPDRYFARIFRAAGSLQ